MTPVISHNFLLAPEGEAAGSGRRSQVAGRSEDKYSLYCDLRPATCDLTLRPANVFRFAREAMRTRFEIVIPGEASSPAEGARARAAAEAALTEIVDVEGWLSAYRPDSALFRVNAEAAESTMRVDGRLFAFMQRAAALTAATGGAFDLTVGPLLRLWGLGHGAEGGNLPTEVEIAAARQLVGMAEKVILDADAQTVAFARPGVRLDPGAMGKGYALDRAADVLREAGIETALLHGGTSSVVALGSPPESPDGWPVAIRHPQNGDSLAADLRLRDQSLGVSAVHGKSFTTPDGAFYGHVIDPRTGRPTQSALLAAIVTVSATDADALSTALLISDPTELRLPERFPQITYALRLP